MLPGLVWPATPATALMNRKAATLRRDHVTVERGDGTILRCETHDSHMQAVRVIIEAGIPAKGPFTRLGLFDFTGWTHFTLGTHYFELSIA